MKYLFAINFISGFLVSFFEIIGLGVIFYYIGIITDPINYLSKYPNLDIFNYILSLDDNSRVIIMSIFLVIVFWSKALMIFFLNYSQAKFNFEFINYISTELFKKYIYKNYYFHIKNNPAILNQRIHNDSNHVGMYFDWSLKFIHSLLFILTILTIFLFNSSSAGIVGIVLVGLIIFLFRFFLIGKIKKRSEYRAINDIELFKTMQHSFGSFIETILFKKQNFFINIFSKYLKEREFQTMYLNVINSLPKIFIEAFFVLGVAMFFSLFYGSSLDLLKILPSIVLMILCLFRLMPNLSIFLLSINQIKFLSVAKNSIAKELKSLENNIINEDKKKLKKKIVFNKNIEIKNVYFKYEENSTDDVLKNVNLTINFGDKIAIVGNSGSGKSTLINLLTGLLRPDSGSILVDDVPIFENIEQWQSIISYIPQEIYLIDDTIEKNITFSSDNEQSDRSWLNYILVISNLYDEVYALKDNINTYVGNRGIKFSGGQKQRIAIARALYKKPKILIMDEPTSGLDFYNELSLIENIISISRDITLVMISHSIERHKGKFKVYELNQNNLIKRP